MTRSLSAGSQLTAALAAGPAIATAFPTANPLADQLKLVARMISDASAIGAKRQVYFVSYGGFDNHSSLNSIHPGLLATVANAMSAFYAATVELGVAPAGDELHRVRLRPHDDRQRWLRPRLGQHALHGRRRGRRGPLLTAPRRRSPTAAPTTSARAGSSRPPRSTSTRRRSAMWFGISDSDLLTVLPNLVNWNATQRNLGFV